MGPSEENSVDRGHNRDNKVIRQGIATAQIQQKNYVNVRHRPQDFVVGDFFFIKVAPMKGIIRFKKKGKLSPRYIGPFEIVNQV